MMPVPPAPRLVVDELDKRPSVPRGASLLGAGLLVLGLTTAATYVVAKAAFYGYHLLEAGWASLRRALRRADPVADYVRLGDPARLGPADLPFPTKSDGVEVNPDTGKSL